MPLVRFEVSNEYKLGQPNLNSVNREDPKQVLDGVAVAGLVGILRQLGDLAQFAAEVFHGIQEQVMTTASRSHTLMLRLQNIEANLPPIERAILAQNTHIHFAYTPGSEWHPRIKNEQNHFIYNDLPRFIMDSYEECPDPPRLQLLDKFDTGGPGSCLKRYSDPTFFKRVSSTVIDTDVEKALKDKKARKNKKKRTSRRNTHPFRDEPRSNQSARFHFTSSIVNGSDSPSQTASMGDNMTMKPDQETCSRSFDSKSGSGYIECVLDTNSPLQSEEGNSKDPSNEFNQNTKTADFSFLDEQARFVDDTFSHRPSKDSVSEDTFSHRPLQENVSEVTFSHRSSHEDAAGISSSVTWDVKEEIAKPKDLNRFLSGGTHLEETESDTENFVDALNTIESESEIDFDIQTRTNVDQNFTTSKINGTNDEDNYPSSVHSEALSDVYPDEEMSSNLKDSVSFESVPSEPTPQISNNKIDNTEGGIEQYETNNLDSHPQSVIDRAEGRIEQFETINFDNHPQTVESQTISDFSPDNKTASNFIDLAPSLAYEQTPQNSFIKTDETEDGNYHPGENSLGAVESLKAPADNETSSEFSSSLPSQSRVDEQVTETSGKSFDFDHLSESKCCKTNDVADSFRVDTVDSAELFPGFGISNTQDLPRDGTSSILESQESHADSSKVPSIKIWTNGGLLGLMPSKPSDFSMSNSRSQESVNGEGGTLDDIQTSKQGTLVENAKRAEKVSPVGDGKLTKLSDSLLGVITNDNVTNLVHPTTESPLFSDVKAISTKANQENNENATGVVGLGHSLLRKVSLVHDGRPQPASTYVGNSEYQTISDAVFKDMFGHGSVLDSPRSSPPLQPMKIAFNPIDGPETSKLKLKFPEGSHNHNRDMFPSFQLVPEPLIHDNRSDSDDDTFCRSSPYMSDDDCLSHESDSDSEQWESGEITSDALCITSSESFSASAQLGTDNKNVIHDNGELKFINTENEDDLPSFDGLNVPLLQDEKNDLKSRNLSGEQNFTELTPIPPPLPPIEWRVSKFLSDDVEQKQNVESEDLNQRLARSLPPGNPNTYTDQKMQPNEEIVNVKPEIKQQDKLKLNREIESEVAESGKGFDEKDDFLQQIRTKSFNLRPTFTVRPPAASSNPATNVKITAILEKANAIRQAVASDDSEDVDNWSDT
ncbi:hypothetical protein ACFE04_020457 [Oxalis oulophora]